MSVDYALRAYSEIQELAQCGHTTAARVTASDLCASVVLSLVAGPISTEERKIWEIARQSCICAGLTPPKGSSHE